MDRIGNTQGLGSGRGRLLVATDLRDGCQALEAGMCLGPLLGLEVVLVRGFQEDESSFGDPAGVRRSIERCEAIYRQSPASVSSTAVVRLENPARLIALTAEELRADLIVLGAGHSPGAILRLLVRECQRSIWLARGELPLRRVCSSSSEIAETFADSLGLPLSSAPPRSSDVLTISLRGEPALARVDRLAQAMEQHPGPIFIHHDQASASSLAARGEHRGRRLRT